jgi:predicted secreted Zn-dependent protease
MKSFIQLVLEAKSNEFANRYLNIHKEHPLVKSNPEEATSLVQHAHQFAQGHDEATYLTRQLLDKTYKPGEDDSTIKSTLGKWRKAKTEGLISGNLSSHTHDTISQAFRNFPQLDMQKNKASALKGMEKYKIGDIDHPEHGKLGVYHVSKSDINDDKEYENISSSLRKTCSGSSWCVLPKEHGPTHLKHYSHGHGIFFYTNDKGSPVLSHGFGDRGIVRPDNSVIHDDESKIVKKQTSSLLTGTKKEKYDFFSGNNTLSKEKQHKMYDEFGGDHGAAHFADSKIDTHPEILDRMLDHKKKVVRFTAISHPNATVSHIDKALNDEDEAVRYTAMFHPKATASHIDKALDDKSDAVRYTAIKHPNATVSHIDKALNDKSVTVRSAAIRHPNVTVSHIDKALNDKSEDIRSTAIRHPNVTVSHIDKALNDTHPYVRETAIRHPNVTVSHIDKALNDKSEDIRSTAIRHPNVTVSHIDKALNDKSVTVRHAAMSHPNATASHIDKALNDTDADVRHAAIRHPKATASHIDKALNDINSYVRERAIQRKSEIKESNYSIINNFKDMISKRQLIKEMAEMKSFIKFISEEKKETKPYKGFKKGINHPEGGLSRAEARRQGIHAGIETKDEAKRKGGFSKLSKKTQARRKRFCARMIGMKRKRTSAKTARDPKSKINASLRVWGCRS